MKSGNNGSRSLTASCHRPQQGPTVQCHQISLQLRPCHAENVLRCSSTNTCPVCSGSAESDKRRSASKQTRQPGRHVDAVSEISEVARTEMGRARLRSSKDFSRNLKTSTYISSRSGSSAVPVADSSGTRAWVQKATFFVLDSPLRCSQRLGLCRDSSSSEPQCPRPRGHERFLAPCWLLGP